MVRNINPVTRVAVRGTTRTAAAFAARNSFLVLAPKRRR